MEFFLEFLLAMALSLILSFFLGKVLSLSSSSSSPSTKYEYDLLSGLKPCNHFIQKALVTCESGSEGEKRDGFVAKVVEGEQEYILLDSYGGTCDENEVLKEVEVVDFGEFGGACGCSQSEEIADLSKDEVGVPKIEEDGGKCSIFDCKEILVDKSNFFESEKIAKTEVSMVRTEGVVVLKSRGDDEDFGERSMFNSEKMLVDKSNFFESENIDKIESVSTKTEVGMARSKEIEVLESKCDNEVGEGNKNEADNVKDVLFDEDGDDDWEGIERTELERIFGAAVAFVENKCNADWISSIGSDVKMQLYGLHKIATVGPCHESQPMALKVSARANWNAWKQLGNTTPEIAMERYVTILSRSIPQCIQGDIRGDMKQVSADVEACSKLVSDVKAYQAGQLGAVEKM